MRGRWPAAGSRCWKRARRSGSAQMLREQGAEVVSVPAVAIVDAADPAPVLAWIERFIADPADYLVLLTGEGLTRLHGLATRAGIGPDFVASLGRTTTIIRGPKPARALRALGLPPQLRAEQATTEGMIAVLSGLESARPARRRAALPGGAEPPCRFSRGRRRLARSGHPV